MPTIPTDHASDPSPEGARCACGQLLYWPDDHAAGLCAMCRNNPAWREKRNPPRCASCSAALTDASARAHVTADGRPLCETCYRDHSNCAVRRFTCIRPSAALTCRMALGCA